jgi:hypothetical protein
LPVGLCILPFRHAEPPTAVPLGIIIQARF